MPVTTVTPSAGRCCIPLTDLHDYLVEHHLEITGWLGDPHAGVVELAPSEDTLPPTIPPTWFGLDSRTRDANLAAVGYRVTRERICRDGSIVYELL